MSGPNLVIVCLLALLSLASAGESEHRYKDSELVTLWVNKVGPYHNPQETYSFYSLPFCQPKTDKEQKHKWDGLGSMLEGNELVDSGLTLKFKEDINVAKICDTQFTQEVAEEFMYSVQNHYWFQMYLDELPIWGMVGEVVTEGEGEHAKSQGFIYTHKSFSIAYNQDQIIQVNLTSENPRAIAVGETAGFTYSVKWMPTDKSFDRRFDIYLDFNFFEHQIHWFSIFNSFMMVIFLCGLVALILMRTLRNDYAKFSAESDELELERVVDESGWKQVHGDVFRAPPFLMVFSALVGTGYQLFMLVFCVIFLSIAGSLYITRGATSTAVIVCYSFTAFFAGYGSASHYKRYGGENWQRTLFLTAVLFPFFAFGLVFFLNFIAILYSSSAAIPFGSMLAVLAIWAFIAVPLTVAGSLIGRNLHAKGDFPCRVTHLRRPIPEGKWYTQPWVIGLFGGILPFGSIFIEMYFVFTSFWNYKFYYVYGFMFLVYCILVIVTVCVTIVSTYFMLNAEDYRWHWTSFFSGASTAIYVYLYAIYYFFYKTHMFGFFQTTFYFGYMFLFSTGLFILCGTVGFFGSSLFVHQIYQNIKSD